jgi:hypothetical protein
MEPYCSKQENQAELSLPNWAELTFVPLKSKVHSSTLQVRKMMWVKTLSIRIPEGEESPTIHIAITNHL